LISGYKSPIDTSVDISYNLRVSSQRMLNGGICGTVTLAERELIKFGFNTSSSCIVQISKDDLNVELGCTNMKRVVFNKLNNYFAPSNFVSKNGNPNMGTFNAADWVNVYPETRTYVNEQQPSLNFSLNTCKNVPFRINAWFFYSHVGKSSGEEIYEIIGSYVR
jgi:hypothetical protein